jgi:hypothetical protein
MAPTNLDNDNNNGSNTHVTSTTRRQGEQQPDNRVHSLAVELEVAGILSELPDTCYGDKRYCRCSDCRIPTAQSSASTRAQASASTRTLSAVLTISTDRTISVADDMAEGQSEPVTVEDQWILGPQWSSQTSPSSLANEQATAVAVAALSLEAISKADFAQRNRFRGSRVYDQRCVVLSSLLDGRVASAANTVAAVVLWPTMLTGDVIGPRLRPRQHEHRVSHEVGMGNGE